MNASDIAGRVSRSGRQVGANPDRVVFAGNTRDATADTDIPIAGDVRAGAVADGRIVVSDGVATERSATDGRIRVASGIAVERTDTVGRVVGTGGVAYECKGTDGRVVEAYRVVNEGPRTDGRVAGTAGVE